MLPGSAMDRDTWHEDQQALNPDGANTAQQHFAYGQVYHQEEGPALSTARHMDYLRDLQIKMRVKKQLSAKSLRELDQERREKGFEIYMQGANEARITQKDSDLDLAGRPRKTSRSSSAGDIHRHGRRLSSSGSLGGWENGGLGPSSGRRGTDAGIADPGERPMAGRKWSIDAPADDTRAKDAQLIPVDSSRTPSTEAGSDAPTTQPLDNSMDQQARFRSSQRRLTDSELEGRGRHVEVEEKGEYVDGTLYRGGDEGSVSGGLGSYEDDFEDIDDDVNPRVSPERRRSSSCGQPCYRQQRPQQEDVVGACVQVGSVGGIPQFHEDALEDCEVDHGEREGDDGSVGLEENKSPPATVQDISRTILTLAIPVAADRQKGRAGDYSEVEENVGPLSIVSDGVEEVHSVDGDSPSGGRVQEEDGLELVDVQSDSGDDESLPSSAGNDEGDEQDERVYHGRGGFCSATSSPEPQRHMRVGGDSGTNRKSTAGPPRPTSAVHRVGGIGSPLQSMSDMRRKHSEPRMVTSVTPPQRSIFAGVQGTSSAGATPPSSAINRNEDMREVLAALERENSSTPRLPPASATKPEVPQGSRSNIDTDSLFVTRGVYRSPLALRPVTSSASHASSPGSDEGSNGSQTAAAPASATASSNVIGAMEPSVAANLERTPSVTSILSALEQVSANDKRQVLDKLKAGLDGSNCEGLVSPQASSHADQSTASTALPVLRLPTASSSASGGASSSGRTVELGQDSVRGRPCVADDVQSAMTVESMNPSSRREDPSYTTEPARGATVATMARVAASEQVLSRGEQERVVDAGGHELVVRIHSTWGGTRVVGLEQLDILDDCGVPLPISREELTCRTGLVKRTVPASDKMAQDLSKLVDGIVGSDSDRHMWIGRIAPDSPLDLCVRLRRELLSDELVVSDGGRIRRARTLRLWNYRRAPNITGIGAKDVDVFLDDKWLWSGSVGEGVPGATGMDGSTLIPLRAKSAPGASRTTIATTTETMLRETLRQEGGSKSLTGTPTSTCGSDGQRILRQSRSGSNRSLMLDALGAADANGPCGTPPGVGLPCITTSATSSATLTATTRGAVGGAGGPVRGLPLETLSAATQIQRTVSPMREIEKESSSVPIWLSDTRRNSGSPLTRTPSSNALRKTAELVQSDSGSSLRQQAELGADGVVPLSARRPGSARKRSTGVTTAEGETGGGSVMRGVGSRVDLTCTTTRPGRLREDNTSEVTTINSLEPLGSAPSMASTSEGRFPTPVSRRGTRDVDGQPSSSSSPLESLMSSFTPASDTFTAKRPGRRGAGNAGSDDRREELEVSESRVEVRRRSKMEREESVRYIQASVQQKASEEVPVQRRKSLQESWESLELLERLNNKGRIGAAPVEWAAHDEMDALAMAMQERRPDRGVATQDRERQPSLPNALPSVLPGTASQYPAKPELSQPLSSTRTPVPLPSVTTPARSPPAFDASSGSHDDLLRDLCNEVLEDVSAHGGSGKEVMAGADNRLESDEENVPSPAVVIPTLPHGRRLRVVVLSNWGDPHYCGMEGIDVFDSHGEPVRLGDPTTQITCSVAAPEGDPRTADKLFDGVNFTRDDLHAWMVPFETNGRGGLRRPSPVRLHVDLGVDTTLAMVRFWNFNKSRAHSLRGVRRVQLVLDDVVVFEGEIRQAPGVLADPEQCSEVVLFTVDTAILGRVEEWDRREGVLRLQDAAAGSDVGEEDAEQVGHHNRGSTDGTDFFEAALREVGLSGTGGLAASTPDDTTGVIKRRVEESRLRRGRRIDLTLDGTWGSDDYIGLGGLQVLIGTELEPLRLQSKSIDCVPARDLRSLGYGEDGRVLENLVKGAAERDTGWLLPLAVAANPVIWLDLGGQHAIAGLVVWNYGRPEEDDTLRGARAVSVAIDGRPVETFALRKAAGAAGLNHPQLLLFSSPEPPLTITKPKPGYVTYVSPQVRQDYETPLNPTGLLLKLILHSTWGDPYYIGIDQIEVLGPGGQVLPVKSDRVHAWPASLAVLGQPDDCRLPCKLVDGVTGSTDASHSWLAPFALGMSGAAKPAHENVVVILFDRLVSLSAVRICNYRKTPSRGVRELSISLDGRLLYRGGLRRAPGFDEAGSNGYNGQSILFTNDPAVVRREKETVAYCGAEEQDVLCIDERQVRVMARFTAQEPDPSAEGVIIDPAKRPGTAVVR